MRELLQILFGFVVVSALIWLLLKAQMFLEDHFGFNLIRRNQLPRVEVQTLFNGNTKDKDQI